MNNPLYRQLRLGNEYSSLIPKSTGERVVLGKGDTQFSIQKIIAWALQYNNQLKNVAPLLQRNSPEGTYHAIHEFGHWHFQYKADGENQLLRSPACAWKQRRDGIDCKSYTIIVSSLLIQLGIKHYIRKIKQPTFNPESFSHVYVIVPVNQQTGGLKEGYHTIDCTLPTMVEPVFIDKKDFFMDKIQYSTGLNGLNGFKWDSVKGYFKTPISCIGGTSYTSERATADIQGIIAKLHSYIDAMNVATKDNNMTQFSELVNRFIGVATWNASLAGTKISERSWNACTKENLKITHETYNFYRYTVVKALGIYLEKYFNANVTPSTKRYGRVSISGNIEEAYFGEWATWSAQNIVFDIPVVNYTLKPNINIPAFEVTPFVYESNGNINALTPQQFLSTLTTVVITAQQIGGGGTPGNGNPNNPTTGGGLQDYESNNKPKTQLAGLGWIAGGLLAFIAYNLMTNKPNPQTANKK